MPAYHSSFEPTQVTGNMGLLPLRTTIKGPAPRTDDTDIIDEAMMFFKPNIFFREFEIKGPADRTLIYITLYISESLRKMQRCATKAQALKELNNLALSHALPIPGEAGFPLNSMYKAPIDKQDEDTMRQYLLQVRQETNVRLADKVYPTADAKPNKWWLCFAKRRFMDKTLVPLGANV